MNQRARLPPTPNQQQNNSTHVSASSIRYQNIDVQNNSIADLSSDRVSAKNQIYNNNNISNDETLNALGPDLALSTSQVIDSLTDHERSIILDVLSRDENIRQRDAARILLLRAELLNLKKRSVLKAGNSLDNPVIVESNRSCARCRTYLGRIINRGAPCRACKLRVCKGCRAFTNKTDWLCVVCSKQIELQNASAEWMNSEVAKTPPRRGSITQGFTSTADIIKKSISRSWTISNPEDDQQINAQNECDPRMVIPTLGSSIYSQETNSYPNLIRMNKSPYNSSMDFNSDSYEHTPPSQRRVLRQSTLPNPDNSAYPTIILKLPVSPKQQVSPQYSPYHTDNENEPENDISQPPPMRYQIRRQSTLPCKPNEHSNFLSTSPNRSYSRSPDPSAVEGEHGSRYPPFVRQSTFPSNNGSEPFHQRQLPTSPNRMSYSKSPDSGTDNETRQVSPRRFKRQITLPNPDQHVKLLPTSPPKKSPQYSKRSPEFQRQNTISNPEGMNTLTVHQHGPKFLPISPRQKQSFLFPLPSNVPRTFLSQQNVICSTTDDDPPQTAYPHRDHAKMIKSTETRRLLPELPSRARSPSRLVRQEHVKDDVEKRSPILKTFAEAKQNLADDHENQHSYTNEYSELNLTFAEADENNYNEFEGINAYQSGASFVADRTPQYPEVRYKLNQPAKSAEIVPNDYSNECNPDEYIKQAQKNRNRRRKSRELPADPDIIVSSTDDASRKHKPETMRSVSEESSPRTFKILPRRSFSQPEKETQRKSELALIPSPTPLSGLAKAPPPVATEPVDEGPKKPVYRFPKMLEMRGDSKSFDAVVRHLIKVENKDEGDKSQSMDDNLFNENKEHKTTLNEAEIQNAVEQAAGLFKKVVLQRRKERKPAEEGDTTERHEESSESEMKYCFDVDDYKLVFLSSDSSGKEDDCDDTSSTGSSTRCSVILDECDWDYFMEPSANNAKILLKDFSMASFSPFGSPSLHRRLVNSSSPFNGSFSHRRGSSESPMSIRKSYIGTDEEISNIESSSQTSSEGCAGHGSHKCTSKHRLCDCGPRYVAIPVPVPMEVFQKWNGSSSTDLLQLLNQHEGTADVTPMFNARQQVENVLSGFEEKEKKRQKISDLSIASNISVHSASADSGRSELSSLSVDKIDGDTCDRASGRDNSHEIMPKSHESSTGSSNAHPNKKLYTNTDNGLADGVSTTNLIKNNTASCASNAIQTTSRGGTMISVSKHKDSDGFLVSESVFSSEEDESGDESSPVQRSYDVVGATQSAAKEITDTSATDATDSEDNVSDLREKSKKFSKVFVVNKNSSTSESDSCSSDDEDASRSEPDGIVLLSYIKPLGKEEDSDREVVPEVLLNDTQAIDDAVSGESIDNKLYTTSARSEYTDGSDERAEDKNNSENNIVASPTLIGDAMISSSSNCNLSMILNDPKMQIGDVSAGSANFDLKTESRDDIVPETGFVAANVDVFPLLSDRGVTTTHHNTESESCVKQNVNGVKAAQEVGGSVSSQRSNAADGNGKFTSLIMITQQGDDSNFVSEMSSADHVSVISTGSTQVVTGNSAITVQHKNWQPRASVKSKITEWEENINKNSGGRPKTEPSSDEEKPKAGDDYDGVTKKSDGDNVLVIENGENFVIVEDGLADDDSWVEDISQQDSEEFATETGSDFDSSDEMTLTAMDREEELRGYNRVSIDFTLHTIIEEESCEESEYEGGRRPHRTSASELEKYFFFGLGDGNHSSHASKLQDNDDSPSEVSSVCSEGLDSLNGPDDTLQDGDETLASSRLEKYFLSGFMGFPADGADGSDGSGSVGSDSEGRPSPEQRRKKLVRARGTGRSHSSSLDNLLSKEDSLDNPSEVQESGDSETETMNDANEKTENHCDTVKRKKKSKKFDTEDSVRKVPEVDVKDPSESENDEDGRKTPQPEFLMPSSSNLVQSRKQHSRDSGFIGSNDDLLKSDGQKSPENRMELEEIQEETKESEPTSLPVKTPPPTNLTRKDSFNAWSSDEETNLMMSKMRTFFKSLVAASANSRNTKTTSPDVTPNTGIKNRPRPSQLAYFESELTRLMKTVPGIKDNQVKELVEYFSSEDTWSDSYDSSDYTSSDKESAVRKSAKIQQQISASCQEIIQKFDNGTAFVPDEEGDEGDGGLNKETVFVYQKLVASITKIADEKSIEAPVDVTNSPPIIAKAMLSHIGSRLVELMKAHEVSEPPKSNSPKQPSRYHRRWQAKISATTTEDDGSTSESNFEEQVAHNLPRSKSHDLLLADVKPSTDVMTGEEREASDYERYSWRGSFESALLTNCDSRNKLSTLDNSSSAMSILAAKRRSAGDLLFSPKSLSREQLDRVRSCGSIGGTGDHDLENSKLWESTQSQESSRRRSGILEDDTDESSDNDHQLNARSTLPRSLQTSSITVSTTNSLPRLPTTSTNSQTPSNALQKAQSVYQFLQKGVRAPVKSARYHAPGFSRQQQVPKRTLSAPGLQPPVVPRRDRRSKNHEETNLSDHANSPVIGERAVVPAASTPKALQTPSRDPWPSQNDEDIDRLVAMHQNRHNSLSSLGLRSDSMASVYSGAGEGRYGTVQVKGSLEFGLQYNYKQGALEIHVKQCKDLAAVDTKRNRSDPYVKVYLLPDKTKSGKRKTKVKKHTLNPVFDEVLRFYMSLSSLESRTLWLTVWHSDMFGRNDFLGEVMLSLKDRMFDNPQPQWYLLEERSEPFEDPSTYRGDIIVGLKFIPGSDSTGSSNSHGLSLRKFSIKSTSSATSASNGSGGQTSCTKNTKGSLHIMVKEAKHLSPVKANGNCDAFCKSYLLPDKNRSSKQKTPVAKRTTSPQWNYTFVYEDVTLAELSERALELTIWDHDRLASNEFLGGIRFSMGTGKHYGKIAEWNDACGKELTLWQSMINRPNFWVEGCLSLRSTLEHRQSS